MSRTSDTGRAHWAENVVVTGTGFFGRDRQQIRHFVQSCGGTYSGDLLLDHTTHLVYKDLDLAKRGEKYTTALSWGIPVLPFSWLQDSAQCRCILPDAYKPSIQEPANASPATKMQQLCLQDVRLGTAANTAHRLHKPSLEDRDRPHTDACCRPQDMASQVKGQHATLLPGQDSQVPLSADAFDQLSCVGSCQPDLSADILPQSPGTTVAPKDTSGSDTCSDRCSPAGSVQQLSEAIQAPAAALAAPAGVAHEAPPQSSAHDTILPDSQPEDRTTYQADQQLAAAMTNVTEAVLPGPTHSPSIQGYETVPDSPLEVADDASHLTVKQPRVGNPGYAAGAVCSTDDSWQVDLSPGQLPAVHFVGDVAAEDDSRCEAIPDTEMQALPSSPADVPHAVQSCTAAVSSSHALVPCLVASHQQQQHPGQQSQHVPNMQQPQQEQHQHKQQWQEQQQQQQQQQQQHQQQQLNVLQQAPRSDEQQEPARLSFADSIAQGSPSTSNASRVFVIEDSDDESDFQPCGPARASTGSCHSHANPSSSQLACHRAGVQGKQGVVPLKLMVRCPRGTSVREHHGLASLKGMQFAEQLQVNGVVLSTKDKKTCACLTPAAATAEKENCCSSDAHILAEVQALYQLPAGSWLVEYLPFFSAGQIQSALAASRSASVLPSGTDHQQELFRGLLRCHAEAASVQGDHAEQVAEHVRLARALRLSECTLLSCSC